MGVRRWLDGEGFHTERRPWMEPGDDLTARRGPLVLSVEAKDQRRFDLAAWIAQAERNCPPGSVPIVVAHRPGRADPEDGYVVMSGSAFADLISQQVVTHRKHAR